MSQIELLPHIITGLCYLTIGIVGVTTAGTRSAFWFAYFVIFCGLSHTSQALENAIGLYHYIHVGFNYSMMFVTLYAGKLFLWDKDSVIIHARPYRNEYKRHGHND